MSFRDYVARKAVKELLPFLKQTATLTQRKAETPYYGEIVGYISENVYSVAMENGVTITARAGGSRPLPPGTGVTVVQGQIL